MSPVVFRHRGFKFHFYANGGNPREPMHVHVLKDNIDAKFWLWPEVRMAYNDGFDARTERLLMELILTQRPLIGRVWNDFFSDSG